MQTGFHACEYPLDCFNYYAPADSVYCEVEQSGDLSRNKDGDSKVASSKIKIGAEIGVKGLLSAAFSFVKEKCDKNKKSGYSSAIESGGYSAIKSGNSSAIKSGGSSAIESGNSSAIKSGDSSAIESGNYSVVYAGRDSKVKAGLHSVIALQYWADDEFKCIKFKEVDGKKIKPDVWYKLDKLGRFIEVKGD